MDPRTDAQQAQRIKKLHSKEAKKRAKLKELGIDYDFAGYAGKRWRRKRKAEDDADGASKKAQRSDSDSAKKKKKKKKKKKTT